jgi:hypothetical protein
MASKKTRRDFLRKGATVTAGLVAAGAAQTPAAAAQPEKHEHSTKPPHDYKDYPRDRPGPGGPLGSPTDRGKLVAGRRGGTRSHLCPWSLLTCPTSLTKSWTASRSST